MNGKDRNRVNSGLLQINNSEYYETTVTGFQPQHSQKIIVPLPLTEETNANKIENLPEKINLPVEPKSKILEKAVVSNSEQKQLFKAAKAAKRGTAEDIAAAVSLNNENNKKGPQSKKKKISASNFSFY